MRPAVIQGTDASDRLSQGFHVLANLLASTLGPTTGSVLIQSIVGSRPEFVVGGALLARQVTQLPGRAEDVGAMLVRHLVWQTHLDVGDGAATAAVLADALLKNSRRYLLASADAEQMKKAIEQAAEIAFAALRRISRPLQGIDDFERLAMTVSGNSSLSYVLAEMFDALGPEGHVAIEEYVSARLEREYLEGGRWDGHMGSAYLFTDPVGRQSQLHDCSVAIFNGTIESADDMLRLVDVMVESGTRHIAVFARAYSDAALGVLVTNRQQGRLRAAAIKFSGSFGGEELEDLAVLTGGSMLSRESGRVLGSVRPDDLGRIRRLESSPKGVAVIGGGGDPLLVREHVRILRERLQLTEDEHSRDRLRFRLARMLGRTGVLQIGAATAAELKTLRHRAEQAIRGLALAAQEGIVPGGGVAFLACARDLQDLGVTGDRLSGWGAKSLLAALEEPFRRIAQNAGSSSPSVWLTDAKRMGLPYGYDAISRRLVHMEEAGIFDPTEVLVSALRNAVSGATLALTVDTLVFRRHPEMSSRP